MCRIRVYFDLFSCRTSISCLGGDATLATTLNISMLLSHHGGRLALQFAKGRHMRVIARFARSVAGVKHRLSNVVILCCMMTASNYLSVFLEVPNMSNSTRFALYMKWASHLYREYVHRAVVGMRWGGTLKRGRFTRSECRGALQRNCYCRLCIE